MSGDEVPQNELLNSSQRSRAPALANNLLNDFPHVYSTYATRDSTPVRSTSAPLQTIHSHSNTTSNWPNRRQPPHDTDSNFNVFDAGFPGHSDSSTRLDHSGVADAFLTNEQTLLLVNATRAGAGYQPLSGQYLSSSVYLPDGPFRNLSEDLRHLNDSETGLQEFPAAEEVDLESQQDIDNYEHRLRSGNEQPLGYGQSQLSPELVAPGSILSDPAFSDVMKDLRAKNERSPSQNLNELSRESTSSPNQGYDPNKQNIPNLQGSHFSASFIRNASTIGSSLPDICSSCLGNDDVPWIAMNLSTKMFHCPMPGCVYRYDHRCDLGRHVRYSCPRRLSVLTQPTATPTAKPVTDRPWFCPVEYCLVRFGTGWTRDYTCRRHIREKHRERKPTPEPYQKDS